MSRFLITLALIAIILFSISCGSSQRSSLNYVPSSSYAVVNLRWPTVRGDVDLMRLIKGQQVASMLTHLGIDDSKVTDIVVFGNMQNSSSAIAGLIVKGTFDTKEVVKTIRNQGWTEDTNGSQRIYSHPTDGSCLSTFGPNLFVAGTGPGVRASIEARNRSDQRFTSSVAYKKLAASFEARRYPVVIMVAIPQVTQDMANTALELSSAVMDYAGVGPLGELMNKIGFAQGVGCAISHERDHFSTTLMAIMKDEEAARFVSGTINLLKSLQSMLPPDATKGQSAEAARAFQNMSVDRTREVLKIEMQMSRRDLFGDVQ